MATNHDNHDPLRNPQVDYDRTDLSAKGILFFLIGLLIAGMFIELVIWGMFRFMAHSEVCSRRARRTRWRCSSLRCRRVGSPSCRIRRR